MIVSIIIPAYNTALYIGRCLDSVCMQTYKDIEIIVIDDASTDNTLSIINQYAKRDKRIKIIHHSENRGNGIGRNTAIKQSHGEYVMFVDSDDEIVENCVEKLVAKLNGEEYDFVVYGYQKVLLAKCHNKRKYSNKILPTITGLEEHDELLHNFLVFGKNVKMAPWLYFCRREFLFHNQIWFDDSGHYFDDIIFTTKLFFYAHKIKVLSEVLYYYTIRHSSIMNSYSRKKIEDRIYAFNSVRDFLKQKNVFVRHKEAYTYFFVHSVFLVSFFDMLKMQHIDNDVYKFMNAFAKSAIISNFHKFDIETLKIGTDNHNWSYITKVSNIIYFISHHFSFSVKYYRFCFKMKKLLSLYRI